MNGQMFGKEVVKETLSDNRLFAHNMNLGHQYHQNDKNDVTLIYIRWYDNRIKEDLTLLPKRSYNYGYD